MVALHTILLEEKGHALDILILNSSRIQDGGEFLVVFHCNPFISCGLISLK